MTIAGIGRCLQQQTGIHFSNRVIERGMLEYRRSSLAPYLVELRTGMYQVSLDDSDVLGGE